MTPNPIPERDTPVLVKQQDNTEPPSALYSALIGGCLLLIILVGFCLCRHRKSKKMEKKDLKVLDQIRDKHKGGTSFEAEGAPTAPYQDGIEIKEAIELTNNDEPLESRVPN